MTEENGGATRVKISFLLDQFSELKNCMNEVKKEIMNLRLDLIQNYVSSKDCAQAKDEHAQKFTILKEQLKKELDLKQDKQPIIVGWKILAVVIGVLSWLIMLGLQVYQIIH